MTSANRRDKMAGSGGGGGASGGGGITSLRSIGGGGGGTASIDHMADNELQETPRSHIGFYGCPNKLEISNYDFLFH